MEKYLFMLILMVVPTVAQPCMQVVDIVPDYGYDQARVAGYTIVSAAKGFVGKRTGWEIGVCDQDGHRWSLVLDDVPAGTQTMLHPDDPNHLLIGFVPQIEGVNYFLFRLADEMNESKFAVLINIKDNTPPRIGWIRKMIGWLFDYER